VGKATSDAGAGAEKRGRLPVVRSVLTPLSAGYGAFVRGRAAAYDRGLVPIHRAAGPVLSVGNIALGGQGKTPLVRLLCQICLDLGLRPAVVSRGYGRRSPRRPVVVSTGGGPRVEGAVGGDEPVMLARALPIAVVADADRVRGAARAFALGADVVLLDDGFQHRRLHRDLDVVVVGEPPPRLLPSGAGREPESALARADLVVHVDPAPDAAPASGIVARARAVAVTGPGGRATQSPEVLRGTRVLLASGIARPERFLRMARELGARVLHHLALPDHARLSAARARALDARARQLGAEAILTTAKDAARWGSCAAAMRVLEIELEVSGPGRERLREAIAVATGL
jgi:tetraacyldisaccharide 4'-kinase